MAWKRKDTGKEISASETEPIKETKVETKEVREAVVSELPQVPARQIRGEDGNVYHLITQNEAIQEILENTREILKIAEED